MGFWEDFGGGQFRNISGKGSGVVRGAEVTGTFDGVFALYDPLDPPQPGTLFTAHYCAGMGLPVPVCEAIVRSSKPEHSDVPREYPVGWRRSVLLMIHLEALMSFTRVLLIAIVTLAAGCSESSSPFVLGPTPPPPPTPPWGSAVVSGIVTDSIEHNPLSGVFIHWGVLSDCEDGGGIPTNANGAYRMSVEPRGSVVGQNVVVIVCAGKEGYTERDESVRLTLDSSETTVNFVLTRSDTNGTKTRR